MRAHSWPDDREVHVFLFFSNRLGCLGSILVSLALSAVIYLVFRAL